jgi:hypothetical protein
MIYRYFFFSNLYITFLHTVSLKRVFHTSREFPQGRFNTHNMCALLCTCTRAASAHALLIIGDRTSHMLYTVNRSCTLSTLPVCGALKSPNVKKRSEKRCLSVER